MKKFLLLVDDQGRIEPVLERAIKGTPLEISSFTDAAAAKRSLIQATPTLILTAISFQDDPDAGFRLSAEIANHVELSKIPLVIFSEELSEDVIHRATESGAKSLIPWPISAESLRNRLKTFLPELEPASVSTKPDAAPAAKVSPAEAAPPDKIKVAQHLLAKVLHNLKTSDLLEVIDLEDVPRVVFEITRAVCEVPSAQAKPPVKQIAPVPAAPPVAAPKPAAKPVVEAPVEAVTGMDLDAIFHLKK